jgi:oligopeptide transport system substrate-binding protein
MGHASATSDPRPEHHNPSGRRTAGVRRGSPALPTLSWRTILLGAAALLAATGCARRETRAAAAVRAQTLLLGNGAEPADLDPQVVTIYTDQNILLALFEGLTAVDEKTSQAVPAAAKSWDVSADGLTWTFHLRDGLRWSNGELLVADDFVQSWQRMLSPALGAEYANLLYPIKNAEAFNQGSVADPGVLGLSAPDRNTVKVVLERPIPYFPVLVAQPPWFPVNPRVLEHFGATSRRGTLWTRPGNLVGNGPFTLEEWIPNARILVAKNPSYWNAETVTLRQIVFFPTENPETEERDFRAGQLHVTYSLPVSKMDTYRRDAPDRLRVDPFLQTFFLRFNVKRPPFDDPRVRRALSLAIDRDIIAKRVLSGAYPPAHSFTPPDCGGYTPKARVDLDAGRARSLLAEAGHAGGAGLPIFEVQVRNDGVQAPVMEAIQAMWAKELGVHVTLATLEQKTWIQNQQMLNYSVSTAGWAGDFLDPVTFLDLFVTDGGNNWTGWADGSYDRLIREAAGTTDPQERLEVFQKAEAYLLEKAPVAPLFFGAHSYLIDPAVKGWTAALLGYHRYALVRLGD